MSRPQGGSALPLKVGAQAASIEPFLAMDVMRRAAALPDRPLRVIHMEVGQPSLGAPAGAIEAASRAIAGTGSLGYTEALGMPALRARIARHYGDRYGLDVAPSRIAVTVGASGAFPLAFLAALDPGDEVALTTPCYPPYMNVLRALGFRPRLIEGEAATRFQPTPALLDRSGAPPPAALLVASPSNPAGTMVSPAELAALAGWARARGTRLISDEIYHGLVHDGVQSTVAADPEAIVVGSFSKYWGMTGWRVGWLVLPEALVRPVERLAQNMFISAPHIAQVAALAAFECGPELDRRVAAYGRVRTHLLARLADAGFGPVAPAQGAFYAYADVSPFGEDSAAFCARLLDEARVAATPGHDFDAARGGDFVRFSYCGPEADMHEATERIVRWCDARAQRPSADRPG